jgi:hypothetical protein
METKKEIVRIVAANGLTPRTELTREELERYELEYLYEVARLSRMITSKGIGGSDRELVLEKMVSLFEYWLRDKLACERVNGFNGGKRK